MNTSKPMRTGIISQERGAILVLVAVLLIVFIGLAAFAIDFGYRHVVKNELQNVADASALAATRELGKIYQGLATLQAQQTYNVDSAGDRNT